MKIETKLKKVEKEALDVIRVFKGLIIQLTQLLVQVLELVFVTVPKRVFKVVKSIAHQVFVVIREALLELHKVLEVVVKSVKKVVGKILKFPKLAIHGLFILGQKLDK